MTQAEKKKEIFGTGSCALQNAKATKLRGIEKEYHVNELCGSD